MGSASFKTNLLVANNELIIGSNGTDFMDYLITDKSSGIYRIDRKTGSVIRHFANESYGDMDVNGILLYNDRLYFGNDNEEFLCTSLDGKILWRNPSSGDIEHEPILINNIGIQQIVYATEMGEVKAIDPTTGKAFVLDNSNRVHVKGNSTALNNTQLTELLLKNYYSEDDHLKLRFINENDEVLYLSEASEEEDWKIGLKELLKK
jgi:outer membrane protein assembly factor BamB